MAWEAIVEEWRGKVSQEAIAEAVRLAREALALEPDARFRAYDGVVNVLDENIVESQRQLLRGWRIRVRQVGHELGRAGMLDDEIIPLLRRIRRGTLFTRDLRFYEAKNRSASAWSLLLSGNTRPLSLCARSCVTLR